MSGTFYISFSLCHASLLGLGCNMPVPSQDCDINLWWTSEQSHFLFFPCQDNPGCLIPLGVSFVVRILRSETILCSGLEISSGIVRNCAELERECKPIQFLSGHIWNFPFSRFSPLWTSGRTWIYPDSVLFFSEFWTVTIFCSFAKGSFTILWVCVNSLISSSLAVSSSVWHYLAWVHVTSSEPQATRRANNHLDRTWN